MVRVKWIDTARGIAILLVLIGHAGVAPKLNQYILSFHMPLFFFLSGVVFDNKKYKDLTSGGGQNYIAACAKRLLIPYAVFDVFILVFSIIDGAIRKHEVSVFRFIISILLCRNLELTGIAGLVLWFLPCIFWVKVIFYYINRKIKLNKVIDIIGITSFFIVGLLSQKLQHNVPFCWDITIMGLVYYWSGNASKKILKNRIEKISYWYLFIISVVCFAGLSGIIYLDNTTTYMYINSYTKFYFLIVETILGILGVIALAHILRNSIFLNLLGRESIYLFCLNSQIYFLIDFLIPLKWDYTSWIPRLTVNLVVSLGLIYVSRKIIHKVERKRE